MSFVRRRVASSDWCASRQVVSISSSPCVRRASDEAMPWESVTGAHGTGAGLVRAHSTGKALRPLRQKHIAPARRDRQSLHGRQRHGILLGAPGPNCPRVARSVDSNISKVVHDLCGAVALCAIGALKLEQLWVLLDERSGGAASQKLGVSHHILQERQVGLHAANSELSQRAVHLLHACVEVRPSGDNLRPAHSSVLCAPPHTRGGTAYRG